MSLQNRNSVIAISFDNDVRICATQYGFTLHLGLFFYVKFPVVLKRLSGNLIWTNSNIYYIFHITESWAYEIIV